MTIDRDETRELGLFFAVTFAFSWLFWILNALAAQGVALPPGLARFLASPFNPAAFGPTVAAFLLTLRQQGGKGALRLLKRGVDLRFNKRWLAAILFLPVLVFGGAILAARLVGPKPLDTSVLANPPYAVVAFVVILFTGGPLQEEFGWRGYALPRLQARFSALASSLILGFFWWLWHLPAIFIPGKFMTNDPLIFLMLLGVIALASVLFTWVYNRTGGSVLSAMLMHTAMNWSIWVVMPSMQVDALTAGFMIGFLAVAVLVIVQMEGTDLGREQV